MTLVERVADLIAWLRKRGEPNSGIKYEGEYYNPETGIRRRAEVRLYAEDADFVAKHFHGGGARAMAGALTAAADEITRLTNEIEQIKATYENLEASEILNGYKTLADRLTAERDEAQSAVTAWQQVFQSIEAHIMDRINMRDPASPETYLSLIRSDVARIDQDSKAIVAARWADHTRQQEHIDRLTAENERLRKVLEVKVKPLVWEEKGERTWITVGRWGYMLLHDIDEETGSPVWTACTSKGVHCFPNKEAAVACLNADHETRIRAALEQP